VTVIKTKEYPPKEFEEYNDITEEDKAQKEGFWKLLTNMPKTMQTAVYCSIILMVPFILYYGYILPTAISQHYFGVPIDFNAETETNIDIRRAFDEAGNWVGMMFCHV
jgi:maltose/moltooligosaccharide transporter